MSSLTCIYSVFSASFTALPIQIDRRTNSLAAFIQEDKIREVQNASDILEVISESVILKKAGKNYQGLCPFHSEKTGSFSVNPSKQIFYCFGCGAGGNVFSFLMKKDGVSFPEAVRTLARRYGVHIPLSQVTPEQKKRMTERDQLLKVNRLAKEFYQNRLNGPGGEIARKYLSKRRLTRETIDSFELGYAPDGWDYLASYFFKERRPPVPIALGEKAGLAIRRKTGTGHYDSFRNRIIFPIFNMNRQVIGFGGRVMDDSLPKYLNSPETVVYNKRASLYGIDRAKQKAREDEVVYVVEGYLDLLAMSQHGITNSVATLGTALTPAHAKLLRGLVGRSGKVILVFDSDAAGIRAAERSIEVFSNEYVNAYILVLPEGHDPDSFLFEHGAEAFSSASAGAMDTISFLIEMAIKRHGLSLDGKIRIISDLKAPLAAIDDRVTKSLYIKALSEKIDVDETAVMEKIHESSPGGSRQIRHTRRDYHSEDSRINIPVMSKQDRMESQIVSMMFQSPSMVQEVRQRRLIDLFENRPLKSIAQTILESGEPREESGVLLNKIEDDGIRALAASLAINENSWVENGCMKLLAQFEKSRNRHKNSLLKDIKAAEAANDQETLLRLLKEKQDTVRKKALPF